VLPLSIAVLGAGALGACSSHDTVSSESTTTTTSSVTTTATSATTSTSTIPASATTAAPCAAGTGSTAAFHNGAGTDTALLTGVTATSPQPCRDVVTFSFRDASVTPGVTVGYRSGPFTEDASGKPVSVAGSAFLLVRFEPAATADLSVNPLVTTYTGPASIVPTSSVFVKQVRKTGDFEGVLNWVVGLASRRPFSVHATGGRVTITIK
jgi:hypothetical protein